MTAEVEQTAAESAPVLDQVVDEVVQVVQNKRAAPMDAAEVRELVEQEWARYDDAPVRTYLPVLVRRAVVGDLLGRD